jgi:hypothetical protein
MLRHHSLGKRWIGPRSAIRKKASIVALLLRNGATKSALRAQCIRPLHKYLVGRPKAFFNHLAISRHEVVNQLPVTNTTGVRSGVQHELDKVHAAVAHVFRIGLLIPFQNVVRVRVTDLLHRWEVPDGNFITRETGALVIIKKTPSLIQRDLKSMNSRFGSQID